MAKRLKSNFRQHFLMFMLSIILVLIVLNAMQYNIFSATPRNLSNETLIIKEQRFVSIDNSTLIKMKLPAVNAEGKGVLTELRVEAMPGSGRALVDIDNLLFWADTQQSIRIARQVAGNVSEINILNYDLIYTIYANASLIGGPSAGAALAIATIAALEGEPLNESVMITGTINENGIIGKVGDIFEKSQAAKAANATLFLVPLGQASSPSTFKTTKECKTYGLIEICTTEQVAENMTENAGIKIVEVKNIKEALHYFIK